MRLNCGRALQMERGRRGNGRSVNDQHLVYRRRDTVSYILRGPLWQGGCKDSATTIIPIAMCLKVRIRHIQFPKTPVGYEKHTVGVCMWLSSSS